MYMLSSHVDFSRLIIKLEAMSWLQTPACEDLKAQLKMAINTNEAAS